MTKAHYPVVISTQKRQDLEYECVAVWNASTPAGQPVRHREKNPQEKLALHEEFFQASVLMGSPCPVRSSTGSHLSCPHGGRARVEIDLAQCAARATWCRLGGVLALFALCRSPSALTG